MTSSMATAQRKDHPQHFTRHACVLVWLAQWDWHLLRNTRDPGSIPTSGSGDLFETFVWEHEAAFCVTTVAR